MNPTPASAAAHEPCPAPRRARQTRVDWFRMLADLKRRGFSTYQLEGFLGISRDKLLGYKNHGVEPRHDDGERLAAFWMGAMGRAREDMPRVEVQLSVAGARR